MTHTSEVLPVDWNAPLEAYHPDGRVVEVTLDGDGWGDDLYGVEGIGDQNAFHEDGRSYSTDWRIRNRLTTRPSPASHESEMERVKAAILRSFEEDMPADDVECAEILASRIISALRPYPEGEAMEVLTAWWEESRRYIYDKTSERREKQIEQFKPRIEALLKAADKPEPQS